MANESVGMSDDGRLFIEKVTAAGDGDTTKVRIDIYVGGSHQWGQSDVPATLAEVLAALDQMYAHLREQLINDPRDQSLSR